MLSMLIVYLKWVLVYEPQVERIKDGLDRLYFWGIYHPTTADYAAALLRELLIIGLIASVTALIITIIDMYAFEDEETKEIEETEEIYYKE